MHADADRALRLENRRLLRQAGRPVIWLTAPAAVIRLTVPAAAAATVIARAAVVVNVRPAVSGVTAMMTVSATSTDAEMTEAVMTETAAGARRGTTATATGAGTRTWTPR